MSWGYHLILDSSRCAKSAIRSSDTISRFAKALVQKIDMVAYGDPQVVHFGSGNKGGFTLVQLIETSNITAHFCEETDDMYLDVFSCKPFDPKDVESTVAYFFNPRHKTRRFFSRQAGEKIIELK